MKNFCISLICLSIIVLTIVLSGTTPETKDEYLRVHIRADSNLPEAQAVKYAVRDEIVNYLTPIVAACESKKALQNALKSHISDMEAIADETLKKHGFTYRSTAEVTAENFPTRVYGELTLEEGYYDALIIKLGSGEGDNWWCVVYPPLCFVGQSGEGFRYKSRIAELIGKWREKYN